MELGQYCDEFRYNRPHLSRSSSLKLTYHLLTHAYLSKKKAINLIVIASHGKTSILKNMLGSVTDKVFRGAKCEVIVVKP